MQDDKFVVIADDLTGATDTGVQFSNYGCSTAVIFNHKNLEEVAVKYEVIVISTESRALPPFKAEDKIKKYLSQLQKMGISKYYKKIDSTLRGNIGVEIKAVNDILKKEAVYIIPALPENGRTTLRGYQYVDNKLLEKTEYARDLLTPVNSSYIPDILNENTEIETEIITRKMLYRNNLLSFIRRKIREGTEYFIFDSKTRDDLKKVAEFIINGDIDPLLCGCAGMGKEIPKIWIED
ncbi:MAG: four-carbon acid sugar kinase family protein [Halanaerobiaceae bacterium]